MQQVAPLLDKLVSAKIFVDDILIENLPGWFTPLLIGMAVTAAGRALVTALQQSILRAPFASSSR